MHKTPQHDNRGICDCEVALEFFYAQECFRRVEAICAFILQGGIGENDGVYYPLIVAIYALYGKPFKKTKVVGALARKIVPAEFRPMHDIMIEHRDEVYAHTQPRPDNEVRVRVSYQEASRVGQLIATEFYARPPNLVEGHRAMPSNAKDDGATQDQAAKSLFPNTPS